MIVKNPVNIDTPDAFNATLVIALDNHEVFYKILRQLDACKSGKQFVRANRLTLREAWNTCLSPLFMTWWLAQLPPASDGFGAPRTFLVQRVKETITNGLFAINRRRRYVYADAILATALRGQFSARGAIR